MIDPQVAAYLKLIHGSYNLLVVCLFVYQGIVGILNRKKRVAGKQPSLRLIKRHRKLGKALTVLGPMGFLAGAVLTYTDQGHLLKYPFHFFFGIMITASIVATYVISGKIKGSNSPWRTPHFTLGILILCLYCIQVILGLGILF